MSEVENCILAAARVTFRDVGNRVQKHMNFQRFGTLFEQKTKKVSQNIRNHTGFATKFPMSKTIRISNDSATFSFFKIAFRNPIPNVLKHFWSKSAESAPET